MKTRVFTRWKHNLITSSGLLYPAACSVLYGWGWGGRGGVLGRCNNVVSLCVLHCSLAFASMQDVTLGDLLLMLRWEIFFCTCTHAGHYAGRSSFARADMRDVTLGDLLLHLHTCYAGTFDLDATLRAVEHWLDFNYFRCRCFVCTFFLIPSLACKMC